MLRATLRSLARWLSQFSACLAAVALAAEDTPERALKPPVGPAHFAKLIRVPLPITDEVDTRLKRAIDRVLENAASSNEPAVLVFEFAPTGTESGEGSNFSRAFNLAEQLLGLEPGKAKTVAFVPRSIKGHAVLPVLACQEVVMSAEATLGEAGVDLHGRPPDETMLAEYRRVAASRRIVPAEVALAMLDKTLEVLRVEKAEEMQFMLRSDLDKLREKQPIQDSQISVFNPPGELARVTGRQARAWGFAKHLAADRAALAKALDLPADALRDDPSLGGKWKAVRVALHGPMQEQLASRVQKMIDEQVRRDVNFVLLDINSPGGSLDDSVRLANFIAGLDSTQVRTVAYIAEGARADAALVAAACDEIVMRSDAVLGGNGAANPSADELRTARETVRESLAPRKGRSWSLVAALVDPSMRVNRYTHRSKGREAYFSEDELRSQDDSADWEQAEPITTPGAPLRVLGERALRLRLASHLAAGFAELRQHYSLEDNVAQLEPGWADFLIDALAKPGVQWLLLFIGLAALWAELNSPGIGVGGFIAGVSFLMYFWGSFLGGTATWLEVLLFLAGALCIVLEIFVIPGVGIFGLGGGLMVLASLILASQTFVWPHNDYQMAQLRSSLLGIMGTTAAVVLFAVVMRRYLPHTPMLSHMVLEPPSETERQAISDRESMVDFRHLVGQHGRTTTPLAPAGKARFGAELIDVTAEGEYVQPGTAVVVVEVSGNRVVVRALL